MKKALIYFLLLSPFILIYYFWNQLPENIPMHWNGNEIDRYSDTKWGIVSLPIINIGVYLLFLIVPYIDPKKNFKLFQSTYQALINIIIFFLFLIFLFVLYASLSNEVNQIMTINNLVFILILLLGNYLGKLRPNYFLGIRTPWTLENEEVWKKTHRLAGILWVTASLIMLLLNFMMTATIAQTGLIIYIIAILGIPFIYSYVEYKKIHAEQKPQ